VLNASNIVTNTHQQLESILADKLAEKRRSAPQSFNEARKLDFRRQFGTV
jgi:hypothetical protein